MNVFLFVNGVVLILMDKLFVFTDNEKLVCSTFTAVISAQNISPDKAMDFEAYVKVEIRGHDGLVKARTTVGEWLEGGHLKFDQTLRLPIPAGAEEIRLKVCKEKKRVFLSGSNVLSNAGIYLRDLLRFVPIEKEFGLFRPTDKTAGGTIKMFFDFNANKAPAEEEVAKPVLSVEEPLPTKTHTSASDSSNNKNINNDNNTNNTNNTNTTNTNTDTPTGGYHYSAVTPQEIATPADPEATSMAQVKSHMDTETAKDDISEMQPTPTMDNVIISSAGTAGKSTDTKKRGFPLLGLLIVVAAAGVGIGIKNKPSKTKGKK